MAEGYKAWSGGQVLNAADLTDYASSQAVMRFANAAGRDAALTVSVVKEGMLAYLKDTNTLTVNTDGTTTGWVQIYPVVTAGITDSQVTNAKLAASSVSSTNIIDGTITGTDIASGTITGANILDRTITNADIALDTIKGFNIEPGTITGTNIASGTITGANIQDGSIGPSDLAGGTYSISISGNAATSTSATSATNATNSTYAVYADELNKSGAVLRWNGSEWRTPDNFYANYVTAGYGILTNPITYANYVTGSSSTTYCVIRSSDNQIVTRSGTSLRDTKTEISDIADADALKTILKLRPRTFRFRDEFVDQEDPASIHDLQVQKQYGLVVEEVLEVNPELIHHDIDKDGNILPKMWKDQAMIALLIGAVKDQQNQIDALVARLDALEATNAH